MKKTIAKSRVQQAFRDSLCTVNVFHGFAHIRECQVENLPYYLPNVGLATLEDVETHFSQSNEVACLTRHGTKYHRLQYIDMHYRYADFQRYRGLGRTLYLAYRNALSTIEDYRDEIEHVRRQYGYTGTDYVAWLEEEKKYLTTVGKEPQEEKYRYLYIEALNDWRAVQ
jgi:hypothetical protein